jgi:hypothetical protein
MRNSGSAVNNLHSAFDSEISSADSNIKQPSVKPNMYETGVHPTLWTIVKDLYDGLTSKIKWCGDISESFPIKQGVRQGESSQLFSTRYNIEQPSVEPNCKVDCLKLCDNFGSKTYSNKIIEVRNFLTFLT